MMDQKYFNEIKMRIEIGHETDSHTYRDIPALLAEVERLTDIEKEYLHYRRLSEKLDQQIAMLKKELEIAGKTLEIQFPPTKAENWVDMWEQQAQEQEANYDAKN